MPAGVENKIREAIEIALGHQRAGRLRAAGNIYRRVLHIAPENPDALHFLGVIAHKAGRADLAIEMLERSVASDPARSGFRLNLGNVYLKQQQVDEAIACYRAAIDVDPMSASAHAHLAAALARQGRLDEANQAYERATALRPLPQPGSSPVDLPALPSPVSAETEAFETTTTPVEPSPADEMGLPPPLAARSEHVALVDPIQVSTGVESAPDSVSRTPTEHPIEAEPKTALSWNLETAEESALEPDSAAKVRQAAELDSNPIDVRPDLPADPTPAEGTAESCASEPLDFVVKVETAASDDPIAGTESTEHRPAHMSHAALALEFAWALHIGPAHRMVSPIDGELFDRDTADAGSGQEDSASFGPIYPTDVPISDANSELDSERPSDASPFIWVAETEVVEEIKFPGTAPAPLDQPADVALTDRADSHDVAITAVFETEGSSNSTDESGRFVVPVDPGPGFDDAESEGTPAEAAFDAWDPGTAEIANEAFEANESVGDAGSNEPGPSGEVREPVGTLEEHTQDEADELAELGLSDEISLGADRIRIAASGTAEGDRQPTADESSPGAVDSAPAGPAPRGAERLEPASSSAEVEAPTASAPSGLLAEAHADVLESPPGSSKEVGVATGESRIANRPTMRAPLSAAPPSASASGKPVPADGATSPRRPPSAETLRRQAMSLVSYRRLDEAVDLLNRAVSLRPKFAEAHRDLGGALLRRGDLDGAIASLRRALRLRPVFAEAWGSLGDAYQLEGKIVQAIRCYRRLLRLVPRAAKVHSNILLSMNYDANFSAEEVFREHVSWAERYADPFARDIKPHLNDRSPNRKLKLGYVSPDFRRHSVNYFAEPVLAGHYRREFHVTCYSDVIRPDGVTRGLADMCDEFRDTRSMNDEKLAERVREDAIDVLIDLSGHTGNNRLGTFARKPAPVQVTYLGYPNTTGLSTIDYRITDAFADPPDMTEAVHSEQLIRLPESFLCYQPPHDSPEVGPLPCVRAGYITFGCFNIMAKITDEVMALWARILQELPNSRLVLKGRSSTSSNEKHRAHVRSVFANHGISADRLELLGKEPSYIQHLNHYRRLDIALDPFPYNGTTTTCEALWMGLPVVTLEGGRHVSRVGVSILSNIGLPELIAATPADYVRIATGLADSQKELSRLRSSLRERMLRSPLTDSIRLTRALEFAYRKMWQHWCALERPAIQSPSEELAKAVQV